MSVVLDFGGGNAVGGPMSSRASMRLRDSRSVDLVILADRHFCDHVGFDEGMRFSHCVRISCGREVEEGEVASGGIVAGTSALDETDVGIGVGGSLYILAQGPTVPRDKTVIRTVRIVLGGRVDNRSGDETSWLNVVLVTWLSRRKGWRPCVFFGLSPDSSSSSTSMAFSSMALVDPGFSGLPSSSLGSPNRCS